MLLSSLRNIGICLVGVGSLFLGWAQDSMFIPSEHQSETQAPPDTCLIHWVKIEILSDSQQYIHEEVCDFFEGEGPHGLRRYIPAEFEGTKIEIEALEAWEIEDSGEMVPIRCELYLWTDTLPAVWRVECFYKGGGGRRHFKVAYRARGLLRNKEQDKEVVWWPLWEKEVAILLPSELRSYTGLIRWGDTLLQSFGPQQGGEVRWRREGVIEAPLPNNVLRVTFREEEEQQYSSSSTPEVGITSALIMVIAVAIFLWAFALSVPLYAGSENVVILEGELPAKDPPALVHAFVAQEGPSPLSFLVAVLDLARRGYVRLIAHPEGFIVQPLKPADASLHPHEQYLLNYLATEKSERVKLKGTLSPALIQFPACLGEPTFIQFLEKFYLLLEEEVEKLGRIPTKSWRRLFGNFLCFVGISLYFFANFFVIKGVEELSTRSYVSFFKCFHIPFSYFILLPLIIAVIYYFKSLKWLILLLLIWLFLSFFCGIFSFIASGGVVGIFLFFFEVLKFVLGIWDRYDSGYFWSETFPLLISVPLFLLSGYLFLRSYRYTVLGKERKKRWERFREWLAELPIASSEVAKHVEVYIPYAVALGVMKPLLSYVRQNLGTQPAPAWLEIPSHLRKLPQEEGASTQMSPTLSDALWVLEKNIDLVYLKMKTYDHREEISYKIYYLVARAMRILGFVMTAPSIYLLVWGFEGLGWEGMINRMAYLLVGLLFIAGARTLRSWVKREEETVKMTEKLRSLWQLLKDRGKMKMEEIAMHLGVSKSEVPKWVYRLASSEAFMGYVDWKDGVLYSADASVLGEGKGCPQCGGQLEPAGKGLFRCQYCGSEVFLKQPVLH